MMEKDLIPSGSTGSPINPAPGDLSVTPYNKNLIIELAKYIKTYIIFW
jgi:hypothetical protein